MYFAEQEVAITAILPECYSLHGCNEMKLMKMNPNVTIADRIQWACCTSSETKRVRVTTSESMRESRAERLEVLEKLERDGKRKRVESSSESESSSDTDDGKRRRRSKKVKREKKFLNVDRWEERRMAARKRTWKAKFHEEKFRVIDDALEPLKEAKKLAKEAGEKKIYKKVKECEGLLQERMKRLMFAGIEG